MAKKIKPRRDLIGREFMLKGVTHFISMAYVRTWKNPNHKDLCGRRVVSTISSAGRVDILLSDLERILI